MGVDQPRDVSVVATISVGGQISQRIVGSMEELEMEIDKIVEASWPDVPSVISVAIQSHA